MKTFTIGWLNKCRCGNKLHTVKTARGNESALWDDDAVKCDSCGRGGVIQVCEGQSRVLWETDEEMAEGNPMSTITKERVAGIARGEKCYTHDDVVELARIALASLEAEAVAYVMADDLKDSSIISTPAYRDLGEAMERTVGDVVALFTAPPAPVSVPDDVMAAMHKVARIRIDLNDFDGDKRGILDCLGDAEEALIEVVNRRAAMLQGAEPVTTGYKLPELRYLDTVKFNADCALQDPESIYAQEFFMSLDEVFGERGNYTEPVQAKAVSILIAEIFRLHGYQASPQQEVK